MHKDIKPENIFLDKNLNAILGDLGLARNFEESPESVNKLSCTHNYCAPEIYAKAKDITLPDVKGPPVDVFALGLTLFYLAMGRSLIYNPD